MAGTAVADKFNVTVSGTGEPTLVLAHGFGSDQTAWRHQVADLAPHHRVVVFDHLGCGGADLSGYDPRAYSSLQAHADDLLQIYAALDLRATVFVGHSAAAMIGMLASFSQPERFARLIFIAASPCYLNHADYYGGFTKADLDRLYDIMADDYLGWANGFGPAVMSNDERPELGREFVRTLAAMRPDIAQSSARLIFEADLRDRLAEIAHPVLLLQTLNDFIVPASVAEFLAAHIAGSQLRILSAHGHVPQLSAPAEVTAAIRAFIAA